MTPEVDKLKAQVLAEAEREADKAEIAWLKKRVSEVAREAERRGWERCREAAVAKFEEWKRFDVADTIAGSGAFDFPK